MEPAGKGRNKVTYVFVSTAVEKSYDLAGMGMGKGPQL